jgi:hypothetical protein
MAQELESSIVSDILSSPRSRAHFLKGAAVAAATFGLGPAVVSAAKLHGLADAVSEKDESTAMILNIAATAEAAAVTALYHVHVAVNESKLTVSGIAVPVNTLVAIVRAALREEQDHYAFIVGAGGKPLVRSFSFPPGIFEKATDTLAFFETAETIFIAAYMTANREFARRRLAKLAQYAYQIGGTECEHRALIRAGLGQLPPNNKSFETNMFDHVSGAATELKGLGIFKPSLHYPGAKAVDTILATSADHRRSAGVIQRHP